MVGQHVCIVSLKGITPSCVTPSCEVMVKGCAVLECWVVLVSVEDKTGSNSPILEDCP